MNTLTELLAELRSRTQPVKVADADNLPKAFIPSPKTIDGYVWPNVAMVDRPASARVLLIEAIGAVGKSAAANAIADQLNWPLIESARAQVGSYSLTGLLHDALGFDSEFMAEVSRGDSGIVIDSLDEAHLRAGTSNLLAFLENVASLASVKAGTGVSIVLLSRPDTAAIIRMAFEDMSAPLAEMRIQFFDSQKAATFINSYLRRQHENGKAGSYDVAIKHPRVFAQLRDERMRIIMEAMLGCEVHSLNSRWSDVRSFLGYAPVLEVLAEALAVPNPHREANRSTQIASSSRKILLSLVSELLEREQGKFWNQTRDSLRAMMPAEIEKDVLQAYSASEQSERLVARMLGLEYIGEHPTGIPDAIRAEYESFAEQFIQDHPFLEGVDPVNVVFGDYLLARNAVDPLDLYAGGGVAIDEASVGPFYYRFVQELAPTLSPDANPSIDERIVSHLIASQAKSQPVDSLARSALWIWTQSDGVASLEIFDPAVEEYLHFTVIGLTGALSLRGQLRQALVLSDEGIILNGADGRFNLGPMAIVVCDELFIDSKVLQIESFSGLADEPYPNIVGARKFDAARLSKVEAGSADAVAIRGDCPWPLLRPYVTEKDPIGITAFSAYMDLRSLFRFFRLGAGAAPNVFAEKLEQGIVKSNERRSHYLERLCDEKIFWKADSHYYLDTEKLALHSVNLQRLVNGQPDVAIFSFIRWLEGR